MLLFRLAELRLTYYYTYGRIVMPLDFWSVCRGDWVKDLPRSCKSYFGGLFFFNIIFSTMHTIPG